MKQLAIVTSSFICALGDNAEVFYNCNFDICHANIDNNFSSYPPGEISLSPIYSAAIADIKSLTPTEQITTMLTTALSQLKISQEFADKKILLYIMLPYFFPQPLLKNICIQVLASYKKIEIVLNTSKKSPIQQLYELCENNNYDAIIYGGIDNLINAETINKLAQKKLLMTKACPYGIIPGQAAAFVLLQQTKNKNAINITNINFSKNIEELCQKLQQTDDLAIHTLGAAEEDPLIWQKINIPAISTHLLLGEIGIATIPMQLVIALTLNKDVTILDITSSPALIRLKSLDH